MADIAAPRFVPRWTVNDRLRKAREVADLTREEMAYELGVNVSSISRYERRHAVRRGVIMVYAMRTGVSARWIETGEESPDSPDDPIAQVDSASLCFSRWPAHRHGDEYLALAHAA